MFRSYGSPRVVCMMQNTRRRRAGVSSWCGVAAMAFAAATAQAADIAGHLKDEPDRRAVKGARIELLELKRRGISGSDGQFQFRNVPPGSYTLRISIDGLTGRFVDKPITVDADNINVVAEITLTTPGTAG